jgi:hypothetical protein
MPVKQPQSDEAVIEFHFGKWRVLDSIIPEDVAKKAMEEFQKKLSQSPQQGHFRQGQRNFGVSHEVKSIMPSDKGSYHVTVKILEGPGGAMLKKLLETGNTVHAVEALGEIKKEGRVVTELTVTSIDIVES